MTYPELKAYLETHSLGIEISGKLRNKTFALTKPASMERAELVEHAATIGVHLVANKAAILADFGSHFGSEFRTVPIDYAAERVKVIEGLKEVARAMGRRLAWYSAYDASSGYRTVGERIPPKATHATLTRHDWGQGSCDESKMPWRELPWSRPPDGWQWQEGFYPPVGWDRPAWAYPPQETKAQRDQKRRETMRKRFPYLFDNPKATSTDWVE